MGTMRVSAVDVENVYSATKAYQVKIAELKAALESAVAAFNKDGLQFEGRNLEQAKEAMLQVAKAAQNITEACDQNASKINELCEFFIKLKAEAAKAEAVGSDIKSEANKLERN